MSSGVAGSGARRPRRLHSQGQANFPRPIKPSVHVEQLSTAILQGDTSNYS